ncbi:nesprin-1-like [Pontoporia blainvillei]|uniref:Nesprin-1-like n=1 Tax=Pontoporia blainvillei TaxID=48723 RepID=A0ABX0S1F2_PONBL|nr:nesprin-1-like [Pontoporia blainvillei]
MIPASPEAYVKLTESAIRNPSGDPSALESQIQQLGKALEDSHFQKQQMENIIHSKTPTGPELDSSYRGYMKLLGECSGSIDSVKRLEHKLTEEEEHFPGFVNLNSTETQTAGVIDRWELLQAQALSKELRMKQNPQRWQQFHSDLNRVLTWLQETEEDLEQLQRRQRSTDNPPIALQIEKLKVATLGLSRSTRQNAATWHARSDETASPGLLCRHTAAGEWSAQTDTNASLATPDQSVYRKAWKG